MFDSLAQSTVRVKLPLHSPHENTYKVHSSTLPNESHPFLILHLHSHIACSLLTPSNNLLTRAATFPSPSQVPPQDQEPSQEPPHELKRTFARTPHELKCTLARATTRAVLYTKLSPDHHRPDSCKAISVGLVLLFLREILMSFHN